MTFFQENTVQSSDHALDSVSKSLREHNRESVKETLAVKPLGVTEVIKHTYVPNSKHIIQARPQGRGYLAPFCPGLLNLNGGLKLAALNFSKTTCTQHSLYFHFGISPLLKLKSPSFDVIAQTRWLPRDALYFYYLKEAPPSDPILGIAAIDYALKIVARKALCWNPRALLD